MCEYFLSQPDFAASEQNAAQDEVKGAIQQIQFEGFVLQTAIQCDRGIDAAGENIQEPRGHNPIENNAEEVPPLDVILFQE